MPKSRRLVAALAVLLLAQTFAFAATPSSSPEEEVPDAVLLEQILRASAIPDALERARLQEALRREIESVAAQLGGGRPTYRKARRLHRILHRRYFRHYEAGADGLQEILDGGRFNCLSATLFYGLIARALGYRPQVVEAPGHLFLRLRLGRRVINVETTAAQGFDVAYQPHSSGTESESEPSDLRWLGRLPVALHLGEFRELLWPVSLQQAVGFVWLNTSWRSLQEGHPTKVAHCVLEARRFLPDLATRAQGVERLLARAFGIEYESGRFDNAYRIAAVGLTVYPSSTTARDRLLAAAVKRIEAVCEEDSPAAGEAILDEVAGMAVSATDLARLERGACPLIAAAAVRQEDWSLARRVAERYAAAERDRVEAARLLAWIEYRSGQSSQSGESVCVDPLKGFPLPAFSR